MKRENDMVHQEPKIFSLYRLELTSINKTYKCHFFSIIAGTTRGKEGERKEITWMKIIQSNSKEIKLKLYIITL